MDGPLWIASYLLLATVVAALTLAVLGVYRLMAASPNAPAGLGWPFDSLAPGDEVSISLAEQQLEEAFVVLVGEDDSSYPLAAATTAVADAWGARVVLAGPGREPPRWLVALGEPGWQPLARTELAAFTPTTDDVVLFIRSGRLIEAASGLRSPAAVAQHFRMAAAPLLATNLGKVAP